MRLVARLEQVVNKTVFGEMSLMKIEPVRIKLREDAKPTCVPVSRHILFPLMDKVKQELERMVQMEVIEEVKEPTEWCSPIVPVLNKDGTMRICVDFKKLNMTVCREHYMLPTLDDITPKLAGTILFGTFDAMKSFWQIPLTRDCTANNVHHPLWPVLLQESALWNQLSH